MARKTLFEKSNIADWQGDYKKAFELMKLAAENHEIDAYNSLGFYYDHGIATRKNHEKAFYWYKKAAKVQALPAFCNIGLTYKERGNMLRAKLWLNKALQAGDDDSALELAKIYLQKSRKDNLLKAQKYLKIVINSKTVYEDYRKEANLLLNKITNKKAR